MSISPFRRAALYAASSLVATALTARADVKLPAIFGDHMVLQEDQKLPVWGTADPGEDVTVTVGSSTGSAKAAADGRWRVDLAPLPKGGPATVMTVKGKNTFTFSDVLIGDVWICSGQSNMEYNMGGGDYGLGGPHNKDTAIAAANDSSLRLFTVKRETSLTPKTDVVGKWNVCTPETVPWFSAVGYFFGQDLRATMRKPIGLICTSWGGTPAQAWTSIGALEKDPALASYVDNYKNIRANYDATAAGLPAANAEYLAKRAVWDLNVLPAFRAAQSSYAEQSEKARLAGQPIPPPPQPSQPMPRKPTSPDGGSAGPANLYNGMIAPLIPFAIKGAIWYQGESNAGQSQIYRKLFPDMITDWRANWGQGDFPFLFVQLASFRAPNTQTWPFVREAQFEALALPKTGMASAVDIGEEMDIHPHDKLDVGKRLAATARNVAYGENAPASGPLYDKMEIKDAAIVLSFREKGSGLVIGSAPWSLNGGPAPLAKELLGFSIAGDDYKWAPADAKIVGDTVVVSSAVVAKPVAVRYSWANWPNGNLYNKEGLPASPFRTDALPFVETAELLPVKTGK